MNKPVIPSIRRHKSTKHKTVSFNNDPQDKNDLIIPIKDNNKDIQFTIYASGAILNKSVDMNNKAKITTKRRKRAKSVGSALFDDNEGDNITYHDKHITNKDMTGNVFASGAVLNKSVDINNKAKITVKRRKRAKSDATALLDTDGDDLISDIQYDASIYASGAILNKSVDMDDKAKLTIIRRAKSHNNVIKDDNDYDYDSIWQVKIDQTVIDPNSLIDAVMDKPKVNQKRKHKTHKLFSK